jgi:hypothetical protein
MHRILGVQNTARSTRFFMITPKLGYRRGRPQMVAS